jgi:hypothetical protein
METTPLQLAVPNKARGKCRGRKARKKENKMKYK